MCEFTWADSSRGKSIHWRRGTECCDECRLAYNSYMRNRQKRRPSILRENQRWCKFRLRPQDIQLMLEAQENCCGICQKSFSSMADTFIDHNHSCDHPGKGTFSCSSCVRGILCNRCNSRLGGVDDKEWLRKALAYLNDDAVTGTVRQMSHAGGA